MNDNPPHMRHLPDLLAEIQEVDRDMAVLRDRRLGPVTRWYDVMLYVEKQKRRAELTAAAHRIYGHTPAHGGRGPSSAGAVAA